MPSTYPCTYSRALIKNASGSERKKKVDWILVIEWRSSQRRTTPKSRKYWIGIRSLLVHSSHKVCTDRQASFRKARHHLIQSSSYDGYRLVERNDLTSSERHQGISVFNLCGIGYSWQSEPLSITRKKNLDLIGNFPSPFWLVDLAGSCLSKWLRPPFPRKLRWKLE